LLALLGAASGKRYGGVEGRAFLEWDKGVMRKITDTRMQWRKANMDLPFTDMAQVYVSMAESGSGFESHISILLSTFSLEAADATRGMFPLEAYTVAQLTAGLDPFPTTGPRRDCLDREWQAAYGQVVTLATAQNRLAAAPSATAAASTAAGVQSPVQGGGLLSFIDGLGRDVSPHFAVLLKMRQLLCVRWGLLSDGEQFKIYRLKKSPTETAGAWANRLATEKQTVAHLPGEFTVQQMFSLFLQGLGDSDLTVTVRTQLATGQRSHTLAEALKLYQQLQAQQVNDRYTNSLRLAAEGLEAPVGTPTAPASAPLGASTNQVEHSSTVADIVRAADKARREAVAARTPHRTLMLSASNNTTHNRTVPRVPPGLGLVQLLCFLDHQ